MNLFENLQKKLLDSFEDHQDSCNLLECSGSTVIYSHSDMSHGQHYVMIIDLNPGFRAFSQLEQSQALRKFCAAVNKMRNQPCREGDEDSCMEYGGISYTIEKAMVSLGAIVVGNYRN